MSILFLIFAAKFTHSQVTTFVRTEAPTIRFNNERDGRLTVTVVGSEIVYSGVFDKAQIESAVRQLGLRQKDRASLYLDAADRCQDTQAAEVLMDLASRHAEQARRIDNMRQQFDIPLAPIGDVNMGVNSTTRHGQNGGGLATPPPTVETFVQRLPLVVTKEMREHMVAALEGVFVPYNRGEVALRAMGLAKGEMVCYVNWQQGLRSLAATILFLTGRATFVLKDEQVVNGCCLPPGSYGNGTPIVMPCGGGERHWQVATALFRDSSGGQLNSASLRTMGARIGSCDGSEFRNIIYLFRPLIFDIHNCPRQNNLFVDGGGEALSPDGGGRSVSLCGG